MTLDLVAPVEEERGSHAQQEGSSHIQVVHVVRIVDVEGDQGTVVVETRGVVRMLGIHNKVMGHSHSLAAAVATQAGGTVPEVDGIVPEADPVLCSLVVARSE